MQLTSVHYWIVAWIIFLNKNYFKNYQKCWHAMVNIRGVRSYSLEGHKLSAGRIFLPTNYIPIFLKRESPINTVMPIFFLLISFVSYNKVVEKSEVRRFVFPALREPHNSILQPSIVRTIILAAQTMLFNIILYAYHSDTYSDWHETHLNVSSTVLRQQSLIFSHPTCVHLKLYFRFENILFSK